MDKEQAYRGKDTNGCGHPQEIPREKFSPERLQEIFKEAKKKADALYKNARPTKEQNKNLKITT